MEGLAGARQDLYLWGARAVERLQQDQPGLGPPLLSVSSWGDPSQGFVLYFPLILGLSYPRGLSFLATFVVSEWGNMVAKWLLHGDRPYWWAAQHGHNITLLQTPLTCETGPGTPSGHSQAAAVIWWVLADTLASLLPGWAWPAWVLAAVMQLLMLLSRTFIAAHFPHQCLLGLLAGLVALRTMYRPGLLDRCPRTALVLASVGLTASAVGVYSLLLHLGFRPQWSIELAKRYCQHQDWIYVDTTPFYAMVRFSGSALGLALSCHAAHPLEEPTAGRRAAVLVTGLGLGRLAGVLHSAVPRTDLSRFYLLEFLLNAFFVMATVRAAQVLLRARRPGDLKVP